MSTNEIIGLSTGLVKIGIEDSENICRLRNDPQNNKFLSSSNPISIKEQENWISKYLEQKNGYYFKIIDLNTYNLVGTISLYDVKIDSAEFGRYICTKSLQAIEAELLLLRFGFEIMSLNRIYCRTAEDNKLVWNQHYKFGFKDNGREYLHQKDLFLKIQELTINEYNMFDNSKIENLITILSK